MQEGDSGSVYKYTTFDPQIVENPLPPPDITEQITQDNVERYAQDDGFDVEQAVIDVSNSLSHGKSTLEEADTQINVLIDYCASIADKDCLFLLYALSNAGQLPLIDGEKVNQAYENIAFPEAGGLSS